VNFKYITKMRANKFLIKNISLIRLSYDEIVINSAVSCETSLINLYSLYSREIVIRLVSVNTNFKIRMYEWRIRELASDMLSSFTNGSVNEAQTDL